MFITLVEQHCLPILVRVTQLARDSGEPLEYLTKHQGTLLSLLTLLLHTHLPPHPPHTGVLTSFLLHQFLTHLALISSQVFMIEYVCSIASLFFKVAHVVHEIIAMLPQDIVDDYERQELNWEPRSELGIASYLSQLKFHYVSLCV